MGDEANAGRNGTLMETPEGVAAVPEPAVPVVELAEAITAAAAVMTVEPVLPPPVVDKQQMGETQRCIIGGSLVAATLLLMTQLIAIWPAVMAATVLVPTARVPDPKPAAVEVTMLFGLDHMTFHPQVVLIVMVLLVGALGALVGSSRRFLYFSTRDELTKRDEWSYLIRPLQGAALALVVYFTLRGGYLGQDASSPVNPYGVAALSALVGLFTRHAVSKLTDVFDTLFGKPKEDVAPVRVKRPDADADADADAGDGDR